MTEKNPNRLSKDEAFREAVAIRKVATDEAREDGRVRPNAKDYQEWSDFVDLLKEEDPAKYRALLEQETDTEIINTLAGVERVDILLSLIREQTELTLEPLEAALIDDVLRRGPAVLKEPAFIEKITDAVNIFLSAIEHDNRFQTIFRGDDAVKEEILSLLRKHHVAALMAAIKSHLDSSESE